MNRIKMFCCLTVALLMLLTCAWAEDASSRAVLLVQLPEDAQMIENVEFEDGDFIQTYQLSGGAHVQLLRYAGFDMTLDELVQSDWPGAEHVTPLDITSVGGYNASGVRLTYAQEDQDQVSVTLVLVTVGQDTLVYQAVYPTSLGEEQIDSAAQKMLDSMDVLGGTGNAMAEVG